MNGHANATYTFSGETAENIRESIKSPKRSSNSSLHRIVLEKTPLNLVKILNVVKRTGDLLKDPPTDSLCVAASCLPFLVYVLCVSNVTSPFSNDYYKDYYCSLSWILVTQLLFRAQNVAPKHKRRGGGTLHFLQLLTSPPCGLISFKIGANLISLLNIMPKVFFCWNENEQFLEEAWSWLTSCATAVRRSTSHFIILGISQKWAVGE